jgi:hypothetical protein
MSNSESETAVPIAVSELSSEPEADSCGYGGEVIHQPDYTNAN